MSITEFEQSFYDIKMGAAVKLKMVKTDEARERVERIIKFLLRRHGDHYLYVDTQAMFEIWKAALRIKDTKIEINLDMWKATWRHEGAKIARNLELECSA